MVIASLALGAAACGRVVSPAPPAAQADLFEQFSVAGVPVSVAAKTARTLGDLQYITRSFGADSTWGYRAVDSIHVRLRYQRPRSDSTRIVAEYWGRCEDGTNSCMRGEFVLLANGVMAEEPVPQ